MKKFLVAFFSVVLCVTVACADISPTIKTTKLPSGQVLWHYSEQLSAEGTSPIKWFVISGSLPYGLDLSEEGLISGTPQREETKRFVVKASNDVGYAIQSLSITINEEPVSKILSGGGCNNGIGNLDILSLMFVFIFCIYYYIYLKARFHKKTLLSMFLCIFIFHFLLPSPVLAKVKVDGLICIVDDAEGYSTINNNKKAPAREEAKRMAFRDALEKALNACVIGINEHENYIEIRNKIFSKASNIVKDFKISNENIEDGKLTLRGTCKISRRALDEFLGPDVIAMLGNPRVMVLVDERVGDQSPFVSTVESEIMRIFEKAGYLIVDPDQAKTLLNLSPAASVFNEPAKLLDAAKTLRADIIIVGKAVAGSFAKQKIHGITLYGVSGTVQLKAVLTQTAYQISSKTISQSTGKKPVQTIGAGAERCFKQASAQAAEEIVYNIAYHMASAGSGIKGITVNIKIANATFEKVASIENSLREFAGKTGELFERSFNNNILEIDLVSDKSARTTASFLSEHGIEVMTFSNQNINGIIRDIVPNSSVKPSAVIAGLNIQFSDVQFFDIAEDIEDILRDFIGDLGKVTADYAGGEVKTLNIKIDFLKEPKNTRELASFLGKIAPDNFKKSKTNNRKVLGIDIDGVSSDTVRGHVKYGFW